MCLSGRHLQFATSQRDGLALMTERVRTHRGVVRTLARLLTVAAIKQTVCRCIWSSVRSGFYKHGVSNRPQPALLSRHVVFLHDVSHLHVRKSKRFQRFWSETEWKRRRCFSFKLNCCCLRLLAYFVSIWWPFMVITNTFEKMSSQNCV